jgi:hypothetical protein
VVTIAENFPPTLTHSHFGRSTPVAISSGICGSNSMAAKAEAANQTRPRALRHQVGAPRKRSEPSLWKANRAPSAASWIGFRSEQVLNLDRATLPPDAEFKGYEEVVVQELHIRTDNVRFRKEKYYAVSREMDLSSNSCSEPEEVAGGCAPTG